MGVPIGGLIGLYGGLICGLIGWYVGRKKASQERGLDETHDYIWSKARSYSWFKTIAAIYFFFSLYLFGVDMSLAMVLGLLIFIQLGVWALSGMALSVMMYSEVETTPLTYKLIGIGLIILSIILSIVLVIIFENWMFILLILPFLIIGFILLAKRTSLQ